LNQQQRNEFLPERAGLKMAQKSQVGQSDYRLSRLMKEKKFFGSDKSVCHLKMKKVNDSQLTQLFKLQKYNPFSGFKWRRLSHTKELFRNSIFKKIELKKNHEVV
jgi:hypothetical protein